MKRELGNGQSIKFWSHNWGHGHLKFELQDLYKEVRDKGITVKLMYQTRNIEGMFQDIGFILNDVQAVQQLNELRRILTVQQVNISAQDNVSWMLEPNRDFSVKLAYLGC